MTKPLIFLGSSNQITIQLVDVCESLNITIAGIIDSDYFGNTDSLDGIPYIGSELDFDFDLVTDQSKENPVFYVQYAYARICSLFKKNKYEPSSEKQLNLSLLNQEIEIDIIKKISEWPKCLELSAYHLEPHRVPFYLYELASLFHTYWNSGNENDNLKILNENKPDLQFARLFLIKKTQIVIKTGLNILNVTAPVEM